MKRKIMICDDEKEILNVLARKINEIQPEKWSIKTTDNISKLLAEFENEVPDVLFLDIVLGKDNGIEHACEIQKRYPYLPIIFITGYNEYAQEIFRIKPIYMLTKPFEEEKIKDALKRAEEFINQCRSSYIYILCQMEKYTISTVRKFIMRKAQREK